LPSARRSHQDGVERRVYAGSANARAARSRGPDQASSELLAQKLGQSRRQFLQTSMGMATAFVAMNQVFGNIFHVDPAEARDPAARPSARRCCPPSSSSTTRPSRPRHVLVEGHPVPARVRVGQEPEGRPGIRPRVRAVGYRSLQVRQVRPGYLPRQRHQDRAPQRLHDGHQGEHGAVERPDHHEPRHAEQARGSRG